MSENAIIIPEDLDKSIEDCDARCDAIFFEVSKAMDAIPPPDTVFHYTDSAGLLGILESGKIRMTDIFSQNDPSELRHGVAYACEILTSEARAAHPAAAEFAKYFQKVINGNLETAAHFFIACFSQNGNDLGQWRAYGDDGRGFAIGFDGKALDKVCMHVTDESNPANATFPITYDEGRLQDLQRRLVREFIPLFGLPEGRGLSEDVINKYFEKLSIVLSSCVIRAASFFKHKAYKNEQEYRFICIRRNDIPMVDLHHRARRYSIVRYTHLNWKEPDPNILREIAIGPAADERAAREFVNSCLLASGYDPAKITIHKSNIPYRS